MEKQKRIKPKLDRRNAVKNIDYDASYSPSSASFSTEGVTSFRIKGLEGEFELICRTLGFTGPEDFAIPTTVWEAQKARRSSFDNSPSPSPQFQSQLLSAHSGNSSNYGANDDDNEVSVSNKLNNARVRLDGGARVCADNSSVNDSNGELSVSCKLSNARVRFCDDTNAVSVERTGNGDSVSERDIVLFDGGARASVCDEGNIGVVERDASVVGGSSKWGGESVRSVKELSRIGGIVGERPARILAPPPGMLTRPLVDNTSSTWDILKSFAPQDDDEGNLITVEGCSSGEDGRVIDENEEIKDGGGSKVNGVFPESCSSLSNEDDRGNGSSVEDAVNSSVVHSVPSTYPSASFRRNIFSWEKGELLGSGSFGTVYEGFTDDGFFFAVKEVSLLDQGSQGRQSILQLEQEISLLREFHHANIVRYLGTQKDETKLYIFLELATKGSLARLYQKYDLRDSVVSAYTRQILSGLKYLHDQNVIHRDIKCANILVDASGSVKLADFGLAKATTMNDVKSCRGTALWMAPEVVNLKNHGYGLPADIWSLGCTVLEMLTGQLPYSHLEGMQALYRIGKGEPPRVPEDLSADARDFIFKCLQVNPANRPKAGELLDHPFVRRPLQMFSSPTSPRFSSLQS